MSIAEIAGRRAFQRVVDWGLVDVFRKHHPEAGQYSFFDYRVPKASDHTVLAAVFEI